MAQIQELLNGWK